MAADEKNMSEFEKRLDRLEIVMEQNLEQGRRTSKDLCDLTKAISGMTVAMAVAAKDKEKQDATNASLEAITSDHESRLRSIELERATEKPSRDFISKNLPILALLVALAYLLMTEIASKYSSTIIP